MRSRKKSKSFWKNMNLKNPKLMGHSESSPEREVHSNTVPPKENRNISNKKPNSTSTRTGGTIKKEAQRK